MWSENLETLLKEHFVVRYSVIKRASQPDLLGGFAPSVGARWGKVTSRTTPWGRNSQAWWSRAPQRLTRGHLVCSVHHTEQCTQSLITFRWTNLIWIYMTAFLFLTESAPFALIYINKEWLQLPPVVQKWSVMSFAARVYVVVAWKQRRCSGMLYISVIRVWQKPSSGESYFRSSQGRHHSWWVPTFYKCDFLQ